MPFLSPLLRGDVERSETEGSPLTEGVFGHSRVNAIIDQDNITKKGNIMLKRVTVVVASYNGAKFIAEQLDSIREQIMKPDEVIIADDCSDDGTVEICEDYIAAHNLEGWTVYRNSENLGVSKNFREALKRATGDYILTCDQDDIWLPDKISAMTTAMNERDEILLLASNYIPVRNGERIKHSYIKNLLRDDGEIVQLKLKDYWLPNLRPGCTFCFRRELLSCFNVMDIPERLHDSMLWKYAIVSDGLYLLNRQLILYRRHEGNATNQFSRTPPNISQRLKGLDSDMEMYRKFLENSEGLNIPLSNQRKLQKMLKFLANHKKILEKRSPIKTTLFVMLHLRYYTTLRNAMSDIYAAIKLRE